MPIVFLGPHTGPPPESAVGIESFHIPSDGLVGGLARLVQETGKRMETLGSLIVAPVVP